MDDQDRLIEDQRIMRMMRKTLTSIVRDIAPRYGEPNPLSQDTILNIKDCLMVISSREAEIADALGLTRNERPHFTDEPPKAHVVNIQSIVKKPN